MTTGEKVLAALTVALGIGSLIAIPWSAGNGSLGAVERLPGGGFVVTGREVPLYRLMALKHALRLEQIGLKMTRGPSAYSIVKREFGIKGNKQKVLTEFTKLVEAAKAAHQGPVV